FENVFEATGFLEVLGDPEIIPVRDSQRRGAFVAFRPLSAIVAPSGTCGAPRMNGKVVSVYYATDGEGRALVDVGLDKPVRCSIGRYRPDLGEIVDVCLDPNGLSIVSQWP
ncbi:MAG: hypothetical protein ACP5HK_00005, partial [Acidilobus sp.]